MGGYGSGRSRSYGAKTTVEACLTLNIDRLVRIGAIRQHPWTGVLEWTRDSNGEKTAAVGYRCTNNGIGWVLTLEYTVTHRDGEKSEVILPIDMQTTRVYSGGQRQWFTCPVVKNGRSCRRRVGRLYLPPGAIHFGCRHCYNLTYKSCNESHKYDSLYRLLAKDTGLPLQVVKRTMKRDIEFMKIDAEGEEANILKGGERFFAELSPLVQYETRARADMNIELVQDFAALGYDSYRLVPGLDLLVPFDAESTPDGYLLNLFCCKQDRIERLVAHGLLTDSAAYLPTTGTERFKDIWGKVKNRTAYHWRHTIAKLPYGAQLANLWEQTMAAGNSAEVDEALSFYALSRDSSRSSTERFGALEASFSLLKILCERQPTYLRLASLARVARDYGARLLAVNALQQLGNAILQHNQVDVTEPFLAPGGRFDSVPPGEAIGNWVLAVVLAELERLVKGGK